MEIAAQFSPLQAVELLGAVFALFLGGYACRNRSESGALPLVVITAGVASWLVGAVGVGFASFRDHAPPAAVVLFFGVTTTVAGWGAFALVFSGRRERVGWRRWALLSVEPLGVVLVLLRTGTTSGSTSSTR